MPAAKSRSALFRYIETLHGDRPWGRVLDAGTGVNSLNRMRTLPTEEWTSVTASTHMADRVRNDPGPEMRDRDRILIGNWASDSLLHAEAFDVVLLDYLIGAVEGFAPYWQERLLARLRPLVRDRLYIVGLEPYVPFQSPTQAGQIMGVGRLRDACLLLAGERPYREFPMEWVIRQLGEAGYRLLDARQFPISYGARFINSQLDMCRDRCERFVSLEVATAMAAHVAAVRERALAVVDREGKLRHGADYVIAAELMR